MSRKVVRVGGFLLVLFLATITSRAFSGEPPKKAPPGAEDNPFGAPPDVARPVKPKPRPDAGDDPFGPEREVVKPDKSTPSAGNDPFGAGPEVSNPATPAISGGKAPTVIKEPSKPAAPSAAKPKVSPPKTLHGGEKAILKALKEQASVDFMQTPLKDVVEYLSQKHRIPILLDAAGLKDAGVDPETPVTRHVSGVSLQSALEIILDELQLKWVIHHEVLLITSPQKAESEEFMRTRRYDIVDLVNQPSDFASEDNPLTAPGAGQQSSNMGMMMAQGMGGSGGMGGNSGMGGYPRVEPPNSLRDKPLETKEITDLIQNTVATKSWIDNGGNGTISSLGGHVLVISQTQEVHRELEQLFAKLRAERRANSNLNVELHWLWLDAKHQDRLLAQTITSRRLRQLAAEVPRFHANVACANGVGTAITSGDRRLQIVSAIPVIGSGVGYQPVTSMPNVGVRAEIRPTLMADGKAAMLFVQSTVTRWTPSRRPAIVGSNWPADQETSVEQPKGNPPPTPVVHIEKTDSGSGSCPIDLPVMPTQEFGTTLRVPLGKPVVVGSVTCASAGDAGVGEAMVDPVEVYLIATTSVVKVKKAK